MSEAGNGNGRDDAGDFREAFEQLPIASVLAQVGPHGTGRFLRVNQAMCLLTGQTRDELLTQTLRGFCDLRDAEASAVLDGLLCGDLAASQFETRYRSADGASHVGQVHCSLVRPGSGEAPYAIAQIRDVTDDKVSEEARSQLAALVDSSTDAIIGATPEGTIVSWNRGAEALYGYTVEEALGEPLLMMVPDDRRDQVAHLLPQIRASERVEGLETVRMAKDGRPVEMSLTISPIKDAAGQLTGVSVIARDITLQKQVEADLTRSSRYFELSRDMVCTADFNGNFKQLNGVWTEVLGWTDSELRSRPFVDFVHPDDREATTRETSRLAEGVTTIGFVNRYATKAGGWRWIDWNARISPDERLIYATARDVTERMTAEAAQAAGEAQTRQILESAHDAFVAMDGTGMITDWNPQAAAVFGWSRQEVLGRDLADTIIPERYRGPHRAGLAHFLATGQGPVLSERIELPAVRRDGREFPVELTISIAPAGDGCSFNAFLRDITDRRQAQQELERARDQALQASVLKSQFLANMSHEIRTPMNGVLGMAELLLDTSLDARQREYAEAVHASGDGLLTLINDILDLSKIEAGGLELEAVDFDVPTSIEDVAALLAGQGGTSQGPGGGRRHRRRYAGSATRRPRPVPPGAHQPARKCRQVHLRRPGRRHRACDPPHGGGDHRTGAGGRHRHRHRGGRQGSHLRPLRPGGPLDHPPLRGHGPGPGDHTPAGRAHGRSMWPRQPGGGGHQLLVHPAFLPSTRGCHPPPIGHRHGTGGNGCPGGRRQRHQPGRPRRVPHWLGNEGRPRRLRRLGARCGPLRCRRRAALRPRGE